MSDNYSFFLNTIIILVLKEKGGFNMKVISRMYLFMFVAVLMLSFSTPVFAGDLDSLGNANTTTSASQGNSGSGNESVTDYLKGYTPITDQNMSEAKRYASPLTNILGTATGFVVLIVSSALFFITALDLCYIAIPPTRNYLNPQAQGGGMSPMGGSMGGSQPQGRRWVSDEAVACVSMSSSQGSGGMSPMGGMGMGGSMGGSQQQPTKSIIMMYLKKRAFFLIIFTVSTILLTSSIFTDCGINLAELSFKVLDKINSAIAGVSI